MNLLQFLSDDIKLGENIKQPSLAMSVVLHLPRPHQLALRNDGTKINEVWISNQSINQSIVV